MQGNRSRDTKPEMAVRSAVHRRGIRFRVSARPQPALARTADLVLRKTRIAVFVDGCYWHGCPDHHTQPATNSQYWADKIARNIERDSETTACLQQTGWTVLRFWEHEDPEAVADPSPGSRAVGPRKSAWRLRITGRCRSPRFPWCRPPVGDHHLAWSRAYSRAVSRSAQKPLVRGAESGSARCLSCLIGNPIGDFPCHTPYVLLFRPVRRHHNYMEGSCHDLGTTSK